MAELREYKDRCFPDAGPEEWIFPGTRNRPLDLGLLMSKHIKPIAKALGIERIHWHALRHLNNSVMLNEGVDVKTRMDRLGHVSENTNMIYSHVGDATQLAASEAIWQRLEVARKELEEKRKAESQTLPQLLSVTQTVTQEIPAPVSN
jgi:site-specific recombinase XerD